MSSCASRALPEPGFLSFRREGVLSRRIDFVALKGGGSGSGGGWAKVDAAGRYWELEVGRQMFRR